MKPVAVLAAGLASATAAIIRPYFDFDAFGTVIGAALTSMVITAGSAIYTAFLQNATGTARSLPRVVRMGAALRQFAISPRHRRRPVLFVGLLTGMIAFIVGIGGVSCAELASGKEPSILGGPPIVELPYLGCGADGVDNDGDGYVDEADEPCQPPTCEADGTGRGCWVWGAGFRFKTRRMLTDEG